MASLKPFGVGPASGKLGWRALAVLAFVAELLLFTSARRYFGLYASPLLFYGSGVLLVVAALVALRDQPFAEVLAPQVVRRLGWGSALAVAGSVLVLNKQIPIVLSQPIDVAVADIVPAVTVYVDRLRSGEVVYKYITSLPYSVYPVYLPFHWLPYVLASKWGIDYRWLSLGILLVVGFGAYQLVLLRRPMGRWRYGLLALLPPVLVWWMLKADPFLYAHVLEPTIICYYFLLVASVFSRSAWLRAGGILLCLLSRYSVLFWVPLFMWMLWREVGKRYALTVAGLIGVGIVGLYVVPFLSENWTHFARAQAEYRLAAINEWGRVEPSTGLPIHLGNGLGAAPWVYKLLAAYPLDTRISWMLRLHVGASAGVVALLAGFYWRYGRRYDYRYLAVVALKLYLATFYFFLQVPYSYLVSLSVLLSVFVLMLVLSGRAEGVPQRPVRAQV